MVSSVTLGVPSAYFSNEPAVPPASSLGLVVHWISIQTQKGKPDERLALDHFVPFSLVSMVTEDPQGDLRRFRYQQALRSILSLDQQ